LVKSSGDFGTQGDLPSHPGLLDWLAIDFRDRGWNVRDLLRSMVNSRAFRQSSQASTELWAQDAENRLLARGPRMRLDAEQVRDNAIFVGGLARLDLGGRGTMPYQPPNIWEPVGFTGSNTRMYQQSKGDALYRRSLYVFIKRTAPAPFMSNFDAPNREVCVLKRDRTNTPLQALVTLNDPVFMEAAQGLARRVVLRELPNSSAQEQIVRVFELAVSRPPSAKEIQVVLKLLSDAQSELQSQREQAMKLATDPLGPLPDGVDPIAMAAWSTVCNIVLNLDEFLMTP
jgi:hypothetical protein